MRWVTDAGQATGIGVEWFFMSRNLSPSEASVQPCFTKAVQRLHKLRQALLIPWLSLVAKSITGLNTLAPPIFRAGENMPKPNWPTIGNLHEEPLEIAAVAMA